jgi:hypothetical protein
MDEKKLREIFDIDEVDLEANRKGRLTEKQKKRFKPQTNSSEWGTWGIGLVFLSIAGMGLFIAVKAVSEDPSWGGRIIFGLAFGVIWPLVWGAIGVAILKSSRRSPYNPRVKAERGRLKLLKHEPRDGIPYFEIKVGSHSAETDADLTDVVAEGEQYALYYLQKTDAMVSLERASTSK